MRENAPLQDQFRKRGDEGRAGIEFVGRSYVKRIVTLKQRRFHQVGQRLPVFQRIIGNLETIDHCRAQNFAARQLLAAVVSVRSGLI